MTPTQALLDLEADLAASMIAVHKTRALIREEKLAIASTEFGIGPGKYVKTEKIGLNRNRAYPIAAIQVDSDGKPWVSVRDEKNVRHQLYDDWEFIEAPEPVVEVDPEA